MAIPSLHFSLPRIVCPLLFTFSTIRTNALMLFQYVFTWPSETGFLVLEHVP